MLNAYVRPSVELGGIYPELSDIVNKSNHVIIADNGVNKMAIIGIEEYDKYKTFLHGQYIDEKLAEAEAEVADPDTEWYAHEEVWEELEREYGL